MLPVLAAEFVVFLVCVLAEKWGFPKLRVPFWGPNIKDFSILGSILGPPIWETTKSCARLSAQQGPCNLMQRNDGRARRDGGRQHIKQLEPHSECGNNIPLHNPLRGV